MRPFREFVKGKIPSLRNIMLMLSMLVALAGGVKAEELSASKEPQTRTERVYTTISQKEAFKYCNREMKQDYDEIVKKGAALAETIRYYCYQLDKADKLDPSQDYYTSNQFLRDISIYTKSVEETMNVIKDLNTGSEEKIKMAYNDKELGMKKVLKITISNLDEADRQITKIGNLYLDVLGINKSIRDKI